MEYIMFSSSVINKNIFYVGDQCKFQIIAGNVLAD